MDLNSGTDDHEIYPFPYPKHASLEKHKMDTMEGGKKLHAFTIQFLGEHHLKLQASRDLVFAGQKKAPPGAPEVFEFVGISDKYQREKEKKPVRHRPPSPKDNRFNSNHEMGYWSQSRDSW
ncbi:hypothetical protein BJX70DRAFT_66823 [Aspergillus crustosus]